MLFAKVGCGLGILVFKQINNFNDLDIAISSLILVLQDVILWVTVVLILLDSVLKYKTIVIGFIQKSFLEMILWSEYHSEAILVWQVCARPKNGFDWSYSHLWDQSYP